MDKIDISKKEKIKGIALMAFVLFSMMSVHATVDEGIDKLNNLTGAVGDLFSGGMLDLVIGGGILMVVVAIMAVVVYVAEKSTGKKR